MEPHSGRGGASGRRLVAHVRGLEEVAPVEGGQWCTVKEVTLVGWSRAAPGQELE